MRTADMRALRLLSACDEGIKRVRKFSTMQEWWERGERADDMAWLLRRTLGPTRDVLLLLADIAATAMPVWRRTEPKDRRPQKCIATLRLYARGKATIAEVLDASSAAEDSSFAAHAAAAYAAAQGAASAAYAAAYSAAEGSASASYAATYVAADAGAHRRLCALIRKRFPTCPPLKEAGRG